MKNAVQTLVERIEKHDFPSYAYTYPPTRMYQSVNYFDLDKVVLTDDVNVYLHIPFCEQKCTFCGYLTTIDGKGDFQEAYVDTIVAELEMKRGLFEGRRVTSVNVGGGTPSLLTINQFERIFSKLLEINPKILETAEEVSIEATPESVKYDKFRIFKELGLNRVSIGIQTLNDEEIDLSNRHNWAQVSTDAIGTLRKAGIPNVCCDLMYGIERQTLESWQRSVNGLLEYRPETIELYALAVQPKTPLGIKPRPVMNNKDKYRCYEIARELLLEAGYIHDSHLRFIIPEQGFYAQQVNASNGQSLVGFGAGARTYAVNVHYRNSFDTRFHRGAIKRYMQNIADGNNAVETAIFLDSDEQMRRYVIGHLDYLDIEEFRQKFGLEFGEAFSELYNTLLERRLANYEKKGLRLTAEGMKFKELITNAFFSDQAVQRERSYWEQVQLVQVRK